MKKIISIVIVMVLGICLSACEKKGFNQKIIETNSVSIIDNSNYIQNVEEIEMFKGKRFVEAGNEVFILLVDNNQTLWYYSINYQGTGGFMMYVDGGVAYNEYVTTNVESYVFFYYEDGTEELVDSQGISVLGKNNYSNISVSSVEYKNNKYYEKVTYRLDTDTSDKVFYNSVKYDKKSKTNVREEVEYNPLNLDYEVGEYFYSPSFSDSMIDLSYYSKELYGYSAIFENDYLVVYKNYQEMIFRKSFEGFPMDNWVIIGTHLYFQRYVETNEDDDYDYATPLKYGSMSTGLDAYYKLDTISVDLKTGKSKKIDTDVILFDWDWEKTFTNVYFDKYCKYLLVRDLYEFKNGNYVYNPYECNSYDYILVDENLKIVKRGVECQILGSYILGIGDDRYIAFDYLNSNWIIDQKGNLLFQVDDFEVSTFAKVISVYSPTNGGYVFVDYNGKVVDDMAYEYVDSLNGGVFHVRNNDGNKMTEYLISFKNGKLQNKIVFRSEDSTGYVKREIIADTYILETDDKRVVRILDFNLEEIYIIDVSVHENIVIGEYYWNDELIQFISYPPRGEAENIFIKIIN